MKTICTVNADVLFHPPDSRVFWMVRFSLPSGKHMGSSAALNPDAALSLLIISFIMGGVALQIEYGLMSSTHFQISHSHEPMLFCPDFLSFCSLFR